MIYPCQHCLLVLRDDSGRLPDDHSQLAARLVMDIKRLTPRRSGWFRNTCPKLLQPAFNRLRCAKVFGRIYCTLLCWSTKSVIDVERSRECSFRYVLRRWVILGLANHAGFQTKEFFKSCKNVPIYPSNLSSVKKSYLSSFWLWFLNIWYHVKGIKSDCFYSFVYSASIFPAASFSTCG